MSERVKRINAGSTKAKSSALSALAQLKSLKEGGQKHAEIFQVKEQEDVFDVMDDEEYSKLVYKRRKDAGGFVVGDKGLGYEDVGEECNWGAADEEMAHDGAPAGNSKSKDKADGKKRPADDPAPSNRRTMQRMFAQAAAAKASAPPSSTFVATIASKSADDVLADILQDLDTGAVQPAPRAPRATSRMAIRSAAAPALLKRSSLLPPTGTAMEVQKAVRFSASASPEPVAVDADEMDDVVDATQHAAPTTDACPEPEVAMEEVTPISTGSPPYLQQPTPERTAVPSQTPFTDSCMRSSEGCEAAAVTPWRTPQGHAEDLAPTPDADAGPTGWQQLYHTALEEASDQPEEPAHDHFNATTPLSNALPFYFIDAHEEAASPDTVYLFGKVSTGKDTYASCCALVRNMQRTVYAIPKPGTVLQVTDPDLVELEERAQNSTEAKTELFRKLHEMLSDVKAEVRDLLTSRHISKFTMRPVKRTYAFEDTSLPRGQQWVLKIKYPATHAPLPLGLPGDAFVKLLGTNTSMLESLLLKRKIMGPGWIMLEKAVAVEAAHQVSWCKVEMVVESPKSVVTQGSSSVLPTAAPPLVTASISLKTMLSANAKSTSEIAAASCVYQTYDLEDIDCADKWKTGNGLRHFSIVRRLDGQTWPAGFEELVRQENQSPQGKHNGGAMLSAQTSERALLTNFMARLQQLDADVYVGHNISAFHLDVLLHRLQHNKVPNWSRLGRLKRSSYPNLSGGGGMYGGGASQGLLTATAGRLLCDTYLASKELLREVEYTLATLSKKLLQQEITELSPPDIPGRYLSAASLLGLMQHAMSDAWLALGLAYRLNVLPLTRQLANLSGSQWGKALQGQRAGRIEMLLLHEFHARKFLLPDKLTNRDREKMMGTGAKGTGRKGKKGKKEAKSLDVVEGGPVDDCHEDEEQGDAEDGQAAANSRKKAAYAGGLVLEPKKGLYDKFVLLLDFNSLYPSIIQEYNIDFSTVQRPEDDSIPPLPETSDELATLPKVIQQLVQRRRQVKNMLRDAKDSSRRHQLDIRQQALKLTANSMYGCLGFTNSRFYAKPLAQLITAQGREILQSTVDLVRTAMGLDVIYGDTDSIMVATGCTDIQEVQKIGYQIKREVNKRYRYLELDMDGVFKCMLLLKKKKYAAVKLEIAQDGSLHEEIEQKGLDIVRRDWCPLSKELGGLVLREVLSGKTADDVVDAVHEHLRAVADKLAAGAVPLGKFVITKQVTKRLEDYPDAKNQPHVQVALRRKAAGRLEGTRPGETVPYIICVEKEEDGTINAASQQRSIAERAYHPEELRSNDGLQPDLEYYRVQQLHPVISRLCAPIEGTDAARLAECLGLDPGRFKSHVSTSGSGQTVDDALLATRALLDDDDCYKNCTALTLHQDGSSWQFAGISEVLANKVGCRESLQPPDAQGPDLPSLSAAALANQTMLAIRQWLATYYDSDLRSDDETHPCETRDICMRLTDAGIGTAPRDRLCTGHMARIVTENMAFTQLNHFRRLLDAEACYDRLNLGTEHRADAMRKLAPIADALKAGKAAVTQALQHCAYRYVNLEALFGTTLSVR